MITEGSSTMANELTCLEQRDGRWHLVSYVIASDGALRETLVVQTPWQGTEAPRVVAFSETAPFDPGPVDWSDVPLRQDRPVVFQSKLRVNDGASTSGKTELEYPPPPWDKDSPQGKQKLGKDEHDIPVPPATPNIHKKGCGFIFEIAYPAGPDACKNKVKQFIKSTVSYTFDTPKNGPITLKQEVPAGDPSTQPNPTPGGFDHPGWGPETEDKDHKTGKNASAQVPSTNGGDKGYLDNTACIPLQPGYRNPCGYDAKVRVELSDCHDALLEWIEFEVHIVIDANGKVTKAEITSQKSGTK